MSISGSTHIMAENLFSGGNGVMFYAISSNNDLTWNATRIAVCNICHKKGVQLKIICFILVVTV